jgi:hypothetical protein
MHYLSHVLELPRFISRWIHTEICLDNATTVGTANKGTGKIVYESIHINGGSLWKNRAIGRVIGMPHPLAFANELCGRHLLSIDGQESRLTILILVLYFDCLVFIDIIDKAEATS